MPTGTNYLYFALVNLGFIAQIALLMYYTSSTNIRIIGTSIDVIKHLEPGLRLKRSKPLKDKESTLDAVMNLQVKVKN